MMRLSKLADYGTVAMGYMARNPGSVHTAPEVAAAVRLAAPTVSKLMKLLARSGLLVSLRGSRGGYRLARRPESITVTDVVEAVEGNIAVTDCGAAPCGCGLDPGCPVQRSWRRINRRLRGVLDSVSVADLAGSAGRRSRARRSSGAGAAREAATRGAATR